jgi:hypothetical protein
MLKVERERPEIQMREERDNEELKRMVFIMGVYMYVEMMRRKSGDEVQQMIQYTKVGSNQVGRNLEGERRGR